MSKLPGYLPLPTHASTDIPERYTDHPFRAIPSFGPSDAVVFLEELDGSSPPETPLNGYFLYKEERRSTKTAVRLMLASILLLVFGLLLWKLVHCQSSDMSVDYEK
ncbi:4298_t:CDS:1 [Paraglomus occultum]|uniref:4298_t:CDS:1 n=1 Tax=Paraglomus occultum TaxID=144539 RepID=A0A9N9AT49_9GLOM|nr:4298_t:CDS:1 [Paraglomus occultum]